MIDEAVFREVYRLHARPLWGYLYRVAGSAADADDLLQDLFVRLMRAPGVPNAPAGDPEMRAYVYKIASNLVADHWRRMKRDKNIEEGARDTEPTVASPDVALKHDMARTFRQLKPQERVLLWLAYVEGSGHQEIADALGLKPKSIRVLLFRARRKLAELLASRGLAEGPR